MACPNQGLLIDITDEEYRDCEVVVVKSVMGLLGVKGVRVKGWAVATRQGTRVDGDSPP